MKPLLLLATLTFFGLVLIKESSQTPHHLFGNERGADILEQLISNGELQNALSPANKYISRPKMYGFGAKDMHNDANMFTGLNKIRWYLDNLVEKQNTEREIDMAPRLGREVPFKR